jgi:hypothetical protein
MRLSLFEAGVGRWPPDGPKREFKTMNPACSEARGILPSHRTSCLNRYANVPVRSSKFTKRLSWAF